MPPRLWTPGVCRHCGGRGYIPHRGEAMAADPCDCDEPGDDDGPDPDDERDKRIDDELMGLNDYEPDHFGDE